MNDGLLHVVFGILFILGAGGVANLRARQESEREHSGAAGFTRLTRALMLLAFGGFGTTMVSAAATRAWPLIVPNDGWSDVALMTGGLLLISLGAAVVISVFIGSRKRTWAADTDTLATTGIYGRTRNPRALGWFLIYAGLALATASAAALALSPVYLLGYLPWILLEETVLERHFGDHYRLYRRTTPRFI